MLVTSLYNVADRAFIGAIPDVGTLAIAGLGITMPVFTLIVSFGVFIGVGTATNIAIKLGEEKKKEAEKYLGNSITLSLTFAISVMILGTIFLDKILIIFGASSDTIFYAKEYISIIIFGSIFSITGFVLVSVVRSEGNPKFAAKTSIVGCILNLILDPLFIFVFGLGIKGAALATVLCQVIIFIWILCYFLNDKSNLKLRKENILLNKSIVISIFVIGAAPFAVELSFSLVNVIFNNVLKANGGDLAIGAMTAITSIILIFLMPVYGMNQGVQTIIGYNYGAKKYDRCKKALILAILSSTIILIVGFILIMVLPKFFISIFNRDVELMNIAVTGLRRYSVTLPLLGLVFIGPSYFQAIGKAKHSMFLNLLRQLIIFIPIVFVLPRIFGLTGVWLVQPLADIISASIIFIFIYFEFKK